MSKAHDRPPRSRASAILHATIAEVKAVFATVTVFTGVRVCLTTPTFSRNRTVIDVVREGELGDRHLTGEP
jgi:hypothetical protein